MVAGGLLEMSYATSRDTINFIDDPIWHLFRQVIRKMRPPRGHEADRSRPHEAIRRRGGLR